MIRGTRLYRQQRAAVLSVLALACWGTVPARGEEPAVTATYLGIEDRQDFAFTSKPQGEIIRPVGLLTWNVPVSSLSTMGLDRNFKSFCAEPFVTVTTGMTYGFAIDPIDKPSIYGLPDNEAGRDTARRKAKFLRELHGRYYADTLPGSKAGPEARAAFQAAVWEVMIETELPDGPMPLNLFTGTFQANYPKEADAPQFVQMAQQYVTSLTGNDQSFFENPQFAGMQLVRLTGLVGPTGAVAQSQLAGRLISGATDTAGGVGGVGGLGGPGSTLGGVGPVGLGGLGGVGGLGGPGLLGPGGIGGIGGFPGGGGFFGLPFGGGSNTTVGSPGSTGGSSGSGTPGIGTGGGSGGSGGGGSGGNGGGGGGGGGGGPSPVPSPAGFILGAIALGALGIRKKWVKAGAEAVVE